MSWASHAATVTGTPDTRLALSHSRANLYDSQQVAPCGRPWARPSHPRTVRGPFHSPGCPRRAARPTWLYIQFCPGRTPPPPRPGRGDLYGKSSTAPLHSCRHRAAGRCPLRCAWYLHRRGRGAARRARWHVGRGTCCRVRGDGGLVACLWITWPGQSFFHLA